MSTERLPSEPPSHIPPDVYARLRHIPYVTLRLNCNHRALLNHALDEWLDGSRRAAWEPTRYPEELASALRAELEALEGPYPVTITLTRVEANTLSHVTSRQRTLFPDTLSKELVALIDGTSTMPLQGRGPNWDDQREKALERAGWACEWCGRLNEAEKDEYGRSLHVHHRIPFREFGKPRDANKLDNLLVVCSGCHKTVENDTDSQRRLSQFRQ